MKKINLRKLMSAVMLVSFAGFMGCNTEDVDYPRAMLDVSRVAMEFGETAGDQTFTVESNREFTVTVEDEVNNKWLAVDPVRGEYNDIITVSVERNPGSKRTATIKVATSTIYKYITVSQTGEGGEVDGEVIYTEDMGSTPVEANTDVGAFSGWSRNGSAGANAAYSGTNVTVRTSSASTGYIGASGGNNVFFGGAGHNFFIKNLDITGKTNFTFKFGLSHRGESYMTVDPNTISFYASVDDVTYTKVEYTCNSAASWVIATAEFKVPEGSTKLYLKFDNGAAASQIRIDDFELSTGGNGNLIEGGDTPPPPPGEYIFSEDVGTVDVVRQEETPNWPYYPDTFDGWSRNGDGASTVTYGGTNASIRTTIPSVGYDGASGGNNVFLGSVGHDFKINGIDITGVTNLTFSFGISNRGADYVAITPNTVQFHASVNGTDYTKVEYTCASEAAWVVASAEFKVPAGSTRLYVKFDNAVSASQIRLDDFKLIEGGNGDLIGGGTTPPPPGDYIYKEDVGTVEVERQSTQPNFPYYPSSFSGWSKLGAGATNVTYDSADTETSIRNTSKSSGYTNASGGNCIFFGAGTPTLLINNIDITGVTNLTFSFGISNYNYPNYDPITSSTIKLSASVDGNNYTQLTYTNDSSPSWVLATAQFSVPAGSTSLYLKFEEPSAVSQIRLDDFMLVEGGSGPQI